MKESKAKTFDGEVPKLQELIVNGSVYLTTYTRKYENRQPWSVPDVRQVISYIPGTIRQILIKEGDTVHAEQKIMVLEAMKMMNTIYAPMAGKIKSVKVKEGDCLPKGTVMIEFE